LNPTKDQVIKYQLQHLMTNILLYNDEMKELLFKSAHLITSSITPRPQPSPVELGLNMYKKI